MPYIAAGTFILGMAVSYFIFARTATRNSKAYLADLVAANELMEDAQKERATLKQQVADLEYKMKELEKDLAFEKGKA